MCWIKKKGGGRGEKKKKNLGLYHKNQNDLRIQKLEQQAVFPHPGVMNLSKPPRITLHHPQSATQSLKVRSYEQVAMSCPSGDMSSPITLPSCPARVFRGDHPGWVHTLAMLSYAPVSKKWPSVAGGQRGKSYEQGELDTNSIDRDACFYKLIYFKHETLTLNLYRSKSKIRSSSGYNDTSI